MQVVTTDDGGDDSGLDERPFACHLVGEEPQHPVPQGAAHRIPTPITGVVPMELSAVELDDEVVPDDDVDDAHTRQHHLLLDGESEGLYQVFAPSVNQPADEREFLVVTGAKTTTTTATTTAGGTRLAATGSDAAGAATGAAALLMAGFAALVIARRRTAQRS